MIVCAITYIPYLIFRSCAELFRHGVNITTLIEYEARVREENK